MQGLAATVRLLVFILRARELPKGFKRKGDK